MATSLKIDLRELLNMFFLYRGRLSADPAQQELYDSLIELNAAVVEKVTHLQELYWNILHEQTLTPRQKANAVKKRANEWKESDQLEPTQPSDFYEEFTEELQRSKEGGELPPWGITIIGGVEPDPDHDPGIYIYDIIDNSITQRSGLLQVFDRIVEVNGTSTREVKHEIAEELLRARNETLALKIMRRLDPPSTDPPDLDILDVYLQTDVPARGFGIAIKGGKDDPLIDDHDGLFISHVSGVAAENGQLDKGDRIISANGTNLEHVTRADATSTITSSPHLLHLRVQKRALLQMAQPDVASSCIRQVILRTYDENYGITLGGTEGKIYVVRLAVGGAAERSGQIFVGDQIISVGEHPTLNSTTEQVYKYFTKYSQQITLKLTHAQKQFHSLIDAGLISSIIPRTTTIERISNESYFRVNFDYTPKLDKERPDAGLEVRIGTIVRIDEYQERREIRHHAMPRWWSALLVEGNNERVRGSIPSIQVLRQGKYPGVILPKSKLQGRSSGGFFRRKRRIKGIWQRHTFYQQVYRPVVQLIILMCSSNLGKFNKKEDCTNRCWVAFPGIEPGNLQVWKTEIEETRIILIVGQLNNLLVDLLIREYPDTYQTLKPLPPGNLLLDSNSPFANACTNIIVSKKHVVLAIGPELLKNFVKLDPMVIVTCPHGVRTGGEMDPRVVSTSDGLLEFAQLEQAQNTANQIRNNFGPFISGIASGSNLGEIYYQVCTLINDNSYRKIVWIEDEPKRRSQGFGPLSQSTELLDNLSKCSN